MCILKQLQYIDHTNHKFPQRSKLIDFTTKFRVKKLKGEHSVVRLLLYRAFSFARQLSQAVVYRVFLIHFCQGGCITAK